MKFILLNPFMDNVENSHGKIIKVFFNIMSEQSGHIS